MASDIANQLPPIQPAPQASEGRAPALRNATRSVDAGSKSFSDELHGAAAAKEAEPTPRSNAGPKESLSPLRRAAQANRQDLENTPVLKLITGHVERLKPEEIPNLVAKNTFLGATVATGDVNAFLAKPMPLGEIAEALDLPPSVMEAAKQLGLDMDQEVSVSDLLQAIGVDPQQVATELKSLKDQLAKTALVGLMQRAGGPAKDSAQSAAATTLKPDDLRNARMTPSSNGPAIMPPMMPPMQMPGVGKVSLSGRGEGDAQSIDPAAMMERLMAGIGGVGKPLTAPTLDLTPDTAGEQLDRGAAGIGGLVGAQAAGLSGLRTVEGTSQSQLAALGTTAADAADAVTGDVSKDKLRDAAGKQLPTSAAFHSATFDAFSNLGDRLRGTDTLRQSGDPSKMAAAVDAIGQTPASVASGDQLHALLKAPSQSSPANANAAATASGADGQLQASDADKTKANPGSVLTSTDLKGISATLQDALRDVSGGRQPGTANPAANALFAGNRLDPSKLVTTQVPQVPLTLVKSDNPQAAPTPDLFPAASPVARGVSSLFSVDDLKLSLAAPAAFVAARGEAGEQGQGQGSANQGDQGANDKDHGGSDKLLHIGRNKLDLVSTHHAAAAIGQPDTFAAQVKGPETATLSTQQRVDLMKKVVERATMLNHAGGGTIRLDLGSPELGPLEMAINLNKDRIDLRVIAGSDHVRDAMFADLGKLKDALGAQNIRLGNVDVGVGQRNPQQGQADARGWSQSAQHGFAQNQNQGQGQNRRDGQDGRPEPRLDLSTLKIPPRAASASFAALRHESGRIAVRA